MPERRKHPRFRAREQTFAALHNDCTRVGRLKNISQGGLAFEYTPVDDATCDGFCVDIFAAHRKFHLSSVPCRTVYDIPLPRRETDGTFFPTFLSRQCGLQFGELTETEAELLRFFLKTYSHGHD
ncbi:MAG: PilZ domain-containing protein [Thermodesulfobacteriota bacterium]|nr:PilZ domain-containing protein [Thermodesulfobacteriota bacterium]